MAKIQTTTRFITVKESQDDVIKRVRELRWITVTEQWNTYVEEYPLTPACKTHEQVIKINTNHIIEIHP